MGNGRDSIEMESKRDEETNDSGTIRTVASRRGVSSGGGSATRGREGEMAKDKDL